MSLLLDENLSPCLIPRLTPLFPGMSHVRDVDLKQADDRAIWNWARQNSYTVVTADSDFVAMVQTGPPPRLVHIERCDFPFRTVEELLRQRDSDIRVREWYQLGSALVLRSPPLKPVGNIG